MSTDQDFGDRLKRANSWIKVSEKFRDHEHAEFIFLYVAFNCMYGRRPYEGTGPQVREDLEWFLQAVSAMHEKDKEDGGLVLSKAVMACREAGEKLIVDHFLCDEYWRGGSNLPDLVNRLGRRRSRANAAIRNGHNEDFLRLVFDRLRVLRNQIVHGSVTFGPGSKGRPSLSAGLQVLRTMIPAFHKLMEKYGHFARWDPIPYPRLGSARHPKIGQVN